MKAENKTTDHNRTIRLSDIPGYNGDLLITLGYVNDDNSGVVDKAVCLDNVVIPTIIDLINEMGPIQCAKLLRLSQRGVLT